MLHNESMLLKHLLLKRDCERQRLLRLSSLSINLLRRKGSIKLSSDQNVYKLSGPELSYSRHTNYTRTLD
jgi:hypothetical protein